MKPALHGRRCRWPSWPPSRKLVEAAKSRINRQHHRPAHLPPRLLGRPGRCDGRRRRRSAAHGAYYSGALRDELKPTAPTAGAHQRSPTTPSWCGADTPARKPPVILLHRSRPRPVFFSPRRHGRPEKETRARRPGAKRRATEWAYSRRFLRRCSSSSTPTTGVRRPATTSTGCTRSGPNRSVPYSKLPA